MEPFAGRLGLVLQIVSRAGEKKHFTGAPPFGHIDQMQRKDHWIVGLGVSHNVGLGTWIPSPLGVRISAPMGPLTLAHGVCAR